VKKEPLQVLISRRVLEKPILLNNIKVQPIAGFKLQVPEVNEGSFLQNFIGFFGFQF
jgi:hypothetical protein